MKTVQNARLDFLLDAVCAIASALSPDTRRLAGVMLTGQATLRTDELSEAADTAVAADLARLLGTLGWLPAQGSSNAV